jgi:GxxExxY protein
VEFDELSNKVLGCAIEVHRELGPGLLESTYECLAYELSQSGIPFNFNSICLSTTSESGWIVGTELIFLLMTD